MLREHPLIILLFKNTIYSLSESKITSLFSSAILRVVIGFLILASHLHDVLEQLKLSLNILLLGSINSVFSLQFFPYSMHSMSRWPLPGGNTLKHFANCHMFIHSPLIDLSLSIKDFVDFLKEHPSVFAFSPQEQPSSSSELL